MIEITDKEFALIVNYVKSNFGINLSEKRTLITGRLLSTLFENGFSSFLQYYEFMVQDITGQAVKEMMNKLTTNHTFFLREKEHFEYLKYNILPYIQERQKSERDLRIWSAGCSSGEEPYTMSMVYQHWYLEKQYRVFIATRTWQT